jgi:hypothetical protein
MIGIVKSATNPFLKSVEYVKEKINKKLVTYLSAYSITHTI